MGRAQSLSPAGAGAPTAGSASGQDPVWQLGKEGEVPQTPSPDVSQHTKPAYVPAQLTSLPRLRASSFCTKIPPNLTSLCARQTRLTGGEKILLSRYQHAFCFHIKLSGSAVCLHSSIPSPGTDPCTAKSCPTAGPDPLHSDVVMDAPLLAGRTPFLFGASAFSIEIPPWTDKSQTVPMVNGTRETPMRCCSWFVC